MDKDKLVEEVGHHWKINELSRELIEASAKLVEQQAEIESLRFQLNGVIKMRNEATDEIVRLRAALQMIAEYPRGGLIDTPEKLDRDLMIGIARAALEEEKPNE